MHPCLWNMQVLKREIELFQSKLKVPLAMHSVLYFDSNSILIIGLRVSSISFVRNKNIQAFRLIYIQ